MTINHSSRLILNDKWRHKSIEDFSTVVDNNGFQYTADFTDGDGDDEAQEMFAEQRSLSAEGYQDYDLAGGIEDRYGRTITFASIKKLILAHISGTDDIWMGGYPSPTTGAFITSLFGNPNDGGGMLIRPSGLHITVAPKTGYAVTGGSADILRIANNGDAAVSYQIILVGTH